MNRAFSRCLQNVTLVLIILLSAGQACVAAPRLFQDHNFAIEQPADWRSIDPPPAHTLAVFQSSDGLKTILVIATNVPANELPIAARDMIAGAKRSLAVKGWQITDGPDSTLGGVPFHTFATRISAAASAVVYAGVAGDEGYMLQGVCKRGDAGSDPEVQAVLRSFRLLSPRGIPAEATRPNSAAYRVGYTVGNFLVIALIGWGLFAINRKAKKARASAAPHS